MQSDNETRGHLYGRTVLVTGGTRGLGLLQADRALAAGARHVTITSRPDSAGGNIDDRGRALQYLQERHGADRSSYVSADVRKACPVRDGKTIDDGMCNGRVFDPAIRESLGLPRQLDSVSLNAGVFGPGDISRRIDKLSGEMWDNVQDTNCKGVFHGLQDFARAQKEEPSDDPAVVVIKSIYGSGASLFGHATYQASKFCAHGLTKQAAIELSRPERGIPRINVNSVSPGFSKSPMTKGFWGVEEVRGETANAHPSGTWVEGDDVAKSVVFMMNPPGAVTGVDLPVDNGVMAESVPGWDQADAIRKVTGEPCCGTVD